MKIREKNMIVSRLAQIKSNSRHYDILKEGGEES